LDKVIKEISITPRDEVAGIRSSNEGRESIQN